MDEARPLRLELLDGLEPRTLALSDLCRRCAEVLGASGVALELSIEHETAVAEGHGDGAEHLADLQAVLGEGPTVDVRRHHRTVVARDLATDRRWPNLAAAAESLAARAVVAVPMGVDSTELGILTVAFDDPTDVDARVTRVQRVADVLTGILVLLPIVAPSDLSAAVSIAATHHGRVHQAAGIVSVVESCTIEEAMLRLRAHAYAHEQSLAMVVDAVIDEGLRLR